MDQHRFDLDLERHAADGMDWECDARPTRPTATLTNSPGCRPAPMRSLRVAERPPLRRVRTDAWSVPASTSWARPSRALRKVARRAVDDERGESA